MRFRSRFRGELVDRLSGAIEARANSRDQFAVSGEEGVRDAKILAAIYDSIRNGSKTIKLV